jgi:hypothetical protein
MGKILQLTPERPDGRLSKSSSLADTSLCTDQSFPEIGVLSSERWEFFGEFVEPESLKHVIDEDDNDDVAL